jgi:hypothetical protein
MKGLLQSRVRFFVPRVERLQQIDGGNCILIIVQKRWMETIAKLSPRYKGPLSYADGTRYESSRTPFRATMQHKSSAHSQELRNPAGFIPPVNSTTTTTFGYYQVLQMVSTLIYSCSTTLSALLWVCALTISS